MSISVPADQIDHFRRRVIQDAMTEATASYWERRARQLSQAKFVQGDYVGWLTVEQVKAHDDRIQAQVDACLNKARLIRLDGVW